MTKDFPSTGQFPAIFVGHGNPMNALEENPYTNGWKVLGGTTPRPAAILSISAHWLSSGTRIHATKHPKTIHDFFGFPQELFDMTYDCVGAPELAESVQSLLAPTHAALDTEWGIDHGTWVVLHHMFPKADVPVFQMSIDVNLHPQQHYELGKMLRPLRSKGVLIIGSGNIVHNLGMMTWENAAAPYAWAEKFDLRAKQLLELGDHDALVHYEKLGREANLAIPTSEHYLPLLYILGLQQKDEVLSFPVEGIAHGSISMRTLQFGR